MQNCLAGKECALAKPDVRAEPIEPELGPMLTAEGTIVAVVAVVLGEDLHWTSSSADIDELPV